MNAGETQEGIAATAHSFRTSEITLRQLATLGEFEECVRFQKEVWGSDYKECVPGSVLKISQKIGGIVAGVFDAERLLGFVYGLTGVYNGEVVHWSHMLAVRHEARGMGLAKRLKIYQRDLLLSKGVRTAFWTYDRLVARNANLNINGLGARITEYIENMYIDGGSDLHRGLGMDRFVVTWHLADETVAQILAGKHALQMGRYINSPIVNAVVDQGGTVVSADSGTSHGSVLRIEIPPDIESIQSSSLDLCNRWRVNTRRAFLTHIEAGYKVVGFYIDEQSRRCFYCLKKEPASK